MSNHFSQSHTYSLMNKSKLKEILVADAENEKKKSRFIIDCMKKKAQVFLRQSCSEF